MATRIPPIQLRLAGGYLYIYIFQERVSKGGIRVATFLDKGSERTRNRVVDQIDFTIADDLHDDLDVQDPTE